MRLYSLNKYIHIRPLAIDWEVKSGEREKDKTLVDKKSTSGGIPAPSPSLHFWCWKNCVNSTQKSHTQSQRMATMREEFILWMDISLHPSSTSQRWWTFSPLFSFSSCSSNWSPLTSLTSQTKFRLLSTHTHRVSGGEQGGKKEVCTLGRLSLKGLLTRNSTKQNPSDHASALYYNMLCAVKFVVPFFCVSLFFYFWRSSSLEFFWFIIIIILFHIFCGALFWFSIALLKSLLVMSALMDLYHQNLWC